MSDNVEKILSDLKGELQTIEGAIETKTRDKNEFLKTTEGEIKSKTKEIEEKTKQKNTVKGDIANLEKIVKEINLISDAYKQGFTSIQTDTTEIEKYLSSKEAMLENAVKDKKDEIISKIDEVDDSITKIKDAVDKLKKDLPKAQEEYGELKVKLDESQNNYNSVKAKQKDIEDKLKKLKELKQSIVKEEAGNNTANIYFFIHDSKKLLEKMKPDILPEAEFKQKLLKELNNLYDAEKNVRDKETLLEKAKNELNEKQKALETAIKDRNQHILEKLKTI